MVNLAGKGVNSVSVENVVVVGVNSDEVGVNLVRAGINSIRVKNG